MPPFQLKEAEVKKTLPLGKEDEIRTLRHEEKDKIPWSKPLYSDPIEIPDITLDMESASKETREMISRMGKNDGQEDASFTIGDQRKLKPIGEINATYDALPWVERDGEPRWVVNPDAISKGGFGSVHEAYDRVLGKMMIAKRMRTDTGDEAAIEREAKTIAAVSADTENVPQVYRVVKSKEGVFIFMEKIEGPTLGDMLYRYPRPVEISPQTTAEMMSDICSTVQVIVNKDLLHRDLKLENIILDKNRGYRPRLIDFGISSAAYPNLEALGSEDYAAPEISKGKPPTQASEVYSLGKILNRLVTTIDTTQYDFAQIESLDEIHRKATANNPEDRYQTIKELHEAINQVRANIEE